MTVDVLQDDDKMPSFMKDASKQKEYVQEFYGSKKDENLLPVARFLQVIF